MVFRRGKENQLLAEEVKVSLFYFVGIQVFAVNDFLGSVGEDCDVMLKNKSDVELRHGY